MGEILYLFGRYADAEQAFQKALGLQRKLADEYPDQPRYKLDLIWTERDRYCNSMDKGDINQAEAAIKNALDINEQLFREYPTNTEYCRQRADAYYLLGDCYRKAGRENDRLEAYSRLTREWEQLTHDYPAITDYAVQLAFSYSWKGSWMSEHGRPAEGIEWRTRAIRTLEAVLKKEPRNNGARVNLRSTLAGRAFAFESLGRYQEACADWDRAIEFDRGVVGVPVAVDQYRMYRARVMARMGEHAKAAAEAQLLTAIPWVTDFGLRDGASVFALSSSAALRDAKLAEAERRDRAARYASQAVECLKKAQATGYFGYDSAARIESVQKDKDLEALRGRQDFQEFLRLLHPRGQPNANP